jgi:hypothetical protein
MDGSGSQGSREILDMKKTVFADFNDLSDYPEADIQQGIPLGLQEDIPELESLTEHEEVILDMPGELQAEGYVTCRQIPQGHYWYGVVTGGIRYHDEIANDKQSSVAS